jgi:hypothetical protein
MSEVTASSNVSPPYVSSPSDAGLTAAAKLVVEGVAAVLQQRALANRAAFSAERSRRNVAAVRALYVGEPE